MLKEKLVATQNQVRKKQSSSYEEILADQMQNNKIFAMQDEPAVEEKKQALYLNSDSDDEEK